MWSSPKVSFGSQCSLVLFVSVSQDYLGLWPNADSQAPPSGSLICQFLTLAQAERKKERQKEKKKEGGKEGRDKGKKKLTCDKKNQVTFRNSCIWVLKPCHQISSSLDSALACVDFLQTGLDTAELPSSRSQFTSYEFSNL